MRMFDRCLGCLGSSKVAKKKGRPLWRKWTTRKRNAENFSKRVIHVGQDGSTANTGQSVDEDLQSQFVGNDVKTSKYTIWSFIPR